MYAVSNIFWRSMVAEIGGYSGLLIGFSMMDFAMLLQKLFHLINKIWFDFKLNATKFYRMQYLWNQAGEDDFLWHFLKIHMEQNVDRTER